VAYTSDFRVKLLMRDIQLDVTKKLQDENIINNLSLRIFDESEEDQYLWSKGGLTFLDKFGNESGSNDAAWYRRTKWIDPIHKKITSSSKPILVIEGTFGTETGNVGSAQKARFNHAVGMSERGITGVYVIPKISEYYKTKETKTNKPPVYVSKSYWMNDIVLACLARTKKGPGNYLMVDAYDKSKLFDLVYAYAKNDKILITKSISSIICEMKEFVKNYDFKQRIENMTSQTVTKITNQHKIHESKWIGKILKHDIRAYTTSKYRNGHIIWGEAEVLHSITNKKVFVILPRLNRKDCLELDKLEKKEWTVLQKTPYFKVISIDEINFGTKHSHLKKTFNDLRGKSMKGKYLTKMNLAWKELKQGLLDGKIRIKR